MALVRKLYEGSTIEIQGKGNIVSDDILSALSVINLTPEQKLKYEKLTPIQKLYYLRIYNAFSEGRAKLLASGDIEITGDAELDNVHVDGNGNFVKPEGTGWGYQSSSTGFNKKSSSWPFTSKGTRNLRQKDLDLAAVVNLINSNLNSTKSLRTPELYDQTKKIEELQKKASLNLGDLGTYTIRQAMKMLGKTSGKEFSQEYNNVYKDIDSRKQFVKDLLKWMKDHPDYDKYDLGDRYTSELLTDLIDKLATAFDTALDLNQFIQGYHKLGLGNIGMLINGTDNLNTNSDEGSNDKYYTKDYYTEWLHNHPEYINARDDIKVIMDSDLDNWWDSRYYAYEHPYWQRGLESYQNLKWTEHINSVPSWASKFAGEYLIPKITSKVTDLSASADRLYRVGKLISLVKNTLLIPAFIKEAANDINNYVAKYLLSKDPELFEEVTYKKDKWTAIIPSLDDETGFVFLFKQDPTTKIFKYTLAHVKDFGDTHPNYVDYKTKLWDEWAEEYKAQHKEPIKYNAPAWVAKAVPAQAMRKGGVIKFFDGGAARAYVLNMSNSSSESQWDPKLSDRNEFLSIIGNLERKFDEWDLEAQDWLRLGSLAADVVALFGGKDPRVLGLVTAGSVIANGVADALDPSVSVGQVFTNAAAHVGQLAGAVLMGKGASELTKLLAANHKTIAKAAPYILPTIFALVNGGTAYSGHLVDAVMDMIKNGNFSYDNVRLGGQLLVGALATVAGFKNAHSEASKYSNYSKTDTGLRNVTTKEGTTKIRESDFNKLSNTEEYNTYDKANTAFKEMLKAANPSLTDELLLNLPPTYSIFDRIGTIGHKNKAIVPNGYELKGTVDYNESYGTQPVRLQTQQLTSTQTAPTAETGRNTIVMNTTSNNAHLQKGAKVITNTDLEGVITNILNDGSGNYKLDIKLSDGNILEGLTIGSLKSILEPTVNLSASGRSNLVEPLLNERPSLRSLYGNDAKKAIEAIAKDENFIMDRLSARLLLLEYAMTIDEVNALANAKNAGGLKLQSYLNMLKPAKTEAQQIKEEVAQWYREYKQAGKNKADALVQALKLRLIQIINNPNASPLDKRVAMLQLSGRSVSDIANLQEARKNNPGFATRKEEIQYNNNQPSWSKEQRTKDIARLEAELKALQEQQKAERAAKSKATREANKAKKEAEAKQAEEIARKQAEELARIRKERTEKAKATKAAKQEEERKQALKEQRAANKRKASFIENLTRNQNITVDGKDAVVTSVGPNSVTVKVGGKRVTLHRKGNDMYYDTSYKLVVSFDKNGGSLGFAHRVIKAQNGVKTKASWYESGIGKDILEDLYSRLLAIKDNPEAMKLLVNQFNDLQLRHYRLRQRAALAGYNEDNSNYWEDPEVEKYQQDFNNLGLNLHIWNHYNNFSIQSPNSEGKDRPTTNGVDGKWSGITSFRYGGREGDLTPEQITEFNNRLNTLGYNFETDINADEGTIPYYTLKALADLVANSEDLTTTPEKLTTLESTETRMEDPTNMLEMIQQVLLLQNERAKEEQNKVDARGSVEELLARLENTGDRTLLTGGNLEDGTLKLKKIPNLNTNWGIGNAFTKHEINKRSFSHVINPYPILDKMELHANVYTPIYFNTLNQIRENKAFARSQGLLMRDVAARNAMYLNVNKLALDAAMSIDLNIGNNVQSLLHNVGELTRGLLALNNQIEFGNRSRYATAMENRGRQLHDYVQAQGKLITDVGDQERENWLHRDDIARSMNGSAAGFAFRSGKLSFKDYLDYINNLNRGGFGWVSQIPEIQISKRGSKISKNRAAIAQANNNSKALDKLIANFYASMNKKKRK